MGGSSPWFPPTEPQPGSKERPQKELFPNTGPTKFPPVREALLTAHYNDLRWTCHQLEELLSVAESDPDFSEKDVKRLDKAVTVMKVGFKLVKKVLNARFRRRHRALLALETT